jgi:hypothetical protein
MAFMRKVLTYFGVVLCMVVEVALAAGLAFACWPNGIGLTLFLFLLIVIGGADSVAFQRITRERFIREQALKPLLNRTRKSNPGRGYWRKAARRWVVCIPILAAVTLSLFVPETLGMVSHLFHRGSGRLLGYRISIPIHWMIFGEGPDIDGTRTFSLVAAYQCKGVFRAGITSYWRRSPPASEMVFYGEPQGDPEFRMPPNDTIIATRTLPFANGTIICWEWIPRYVLGERDRLLSITCATSHRDFIASFGGDRGDAPDFYRTVQRVKKTQ